MTTKQLVPHQDYVKFIAKAPNQISTFLEEIVAWFRSEKKIQLTIDELKLSKVVTTDFDYYETFMVECSIPEAKEVLKETPYTVIVKD